MLPVNGMNNINNVKSRAIDCLLMKPTRRLTNIRLTICKRVRKKVGAQGFEPCPAGFFFRTAASFCESCGKSRVGAPVGHQLSANPLVVIPVQLEPAVLPSYTIPPRCMHLEKISPLLGVVHVFAFAIFSCAISSVDCRSSSTHGFLSSW